MPPQGTLSSPWQKRVLVPFWVIRLLLMAFVVGTYALALALLAKAKDDDDEPNGYKNGLEAPSEYGEVKITSGRIAVIAVFFVLLAICLILDIVAIILYARRALKPLIFLIFNVIQTTFWAVILVLDIVAAASNHSAINFLASLIVFALYLGLLIYASVIYHRFRRDANRGSYLPTANPAYANSNVNVNAAAGAVPPYGPQTTGAIYTEAYAPYAAQPQTQFKSEAQGAGAAGYYSSGVSPLPSPHPEAGQAFEMEGRGGAGAGVRWG